MITYAAEYQKLGTERRLCTVSLDYNFYIWQKDCL